MLALARLQDKGFLSGAEYGRLASAYQFLRQLEHRLQIADDRQTHTLPSNRTLSNCWPGACPPAAVRLTGCWIKPGFTAAST